VSHSPRYKYRNFDKQDQLTITFVQRPLGMSYIDPLPIKIGNSFVEKAKQAKASNQLIMSL
jgi:hypothetical protein